MPAGKGDATQGRALFMARTKAPCTGCHLIPGDDVWPAGSVGPDLSVIGDRRLPDQYLFDFIWDRSEEHTSELQSHSDLVCRLLLEKKNNNVSDHDQAQPAEPDR